MLEWHHD
jgi:hypothetical protein